MRQIIDTISNRILLALFDSLLYLGGWDIVHYYDDGTYEVSNHFLSRKPSVKTLFMRPCSPTYIYQNGKIHKLP